MATATGKKLDRKTVLEAAVLLVDEEGIERLSMRNLAKRLGVGPMALYNHVPNKEMLLDGIIETVMAKMRLVADDKTRWEVRIRENMLEFRRVAHLHPKVFRLFGVRATVQIPRVLRLIEDLLDALRGAGFDPDTALHAYRTLMNYTKGYVLTEVRGFGLEADDARLPPLFRQPRPDPADYPRIVELAPYLEGVDHDEEFVFGLRSILTGIKAELEERPG